MQASSLVTWGIAGLSALVALGFAAGYGAASQGSRLRESAKALFWGALWMALFGGLARLGLFARFEPRPPPMAFLLVASLGVGLVLGLSRVGTRFAHGLPLAVLVGAQGFRLPLELVMHQAAGEGVMPVEMSFSGYNFDIVTGASAVLVAGLLVADRAPRALVLAWNLLGSALLLVILTIAVMATPLFHAFGSEPAHLNTWIAYFPFVWLPCVLVSSALFGHIVIFRALFANRAVRATSASHSAIALHVH